VGDGDRNNPGLILEGGYAGITDPSQALGDDGGAIANAGGTVIVDNVRFFNNTATDDGGAIINVALNNSGGSAALTVFDSAFINNTAIGDGPPSPDGGGAIENDSNLDESSGVMATLTVENVLFQNNSSGGTGGAVRNRDGGDASVLQSDFVGNTAASGSADISQTNSSGTTTTLEIDQDTFDALDDSSINGSGDNDIEIVDANLPIISVFQIIGAPDDVDPSQPDIPLSDGQASRIDLGSVIEGNPVTPVAFRVRNDGAADLNLTAQPSASSPFTVTTFATTTVTPGAFVDFNVEFPSSPVGTLNGSVEFGTGTTGDGTFNFDVQAVVNPSSPQIKVELLQAGNPVGEIDDNRLVPISLGNVIQGPGPVTPTSFRITNTGDQDLTLGNVSFTGSDSASFNVNTQPTTPLTPGATTTFDISYDTTVPPATLNGTVGFTTNAFNNPDGTFNFAVQGTVNAGDPTIVVTKINGIPETATDGATTPIFLGDTPSGTPREVTFEVANAGNSELILAVPTLTNMDGFMLGTSSFNPTLAPGATTSFTVTFEGTAQATLDTVVQIGEAGEDPTVSSDGIFDFAIRGTIDGGIATPVPVGDTLTFDGGDRVFIIGDTTQSGSNLELKLNSISSSKILDVRASKVDSSNQVLETTSPLAILPGGLRPNGFSASSQASIFGFSSLASGDRLVVEVQTIDGQTITFNSNQIRVSDIGGGQFSLTFSDNSFGSLELILRQTTVGDPLGSTNNQRQDLEILDLSGVSGNANASFTVYREAVFSNFVGFYRIDDLSGTVGGIAPGQSGYAQAAINARVSAIELSVSNQGLATASAGLSGSAFYAPFILVQAGVNQFLEENPDNFAGAGPQAYFVFQGANPDGVDHIRLLGDNTFGFEDLPGGGDRDFNDIIVKVDISIA
ncbi:MAG: choice-of-anchor D domain-containing protein, partial [Spirulinaceae cyanobacterium RM2_2_10]|nr:choice-of-anchor D domain-containing protein [Spirulinaceae cyanobacterium RM2_2_10]